MIISKYYPITKPRYQILKHDYLKILSYYKTLISNLKAWLFQKSNDYRSQELLCLWISGSSIELHILGIKYWSPYSWDQVLISILLGSSIDLHILRIKYWSPYSWDQVLISIFLGSSIDLHILGIKYWSPYSWD